MLREYVKILKVTGSGGKFALLLLLRAPFDAVSTLALAEFLRVVFEAAELGDTGLLAGACFKFFIRVLLLFLYNGTVWNLYAPFAARLEGRLRLALYGKISGLSYERMEATSQGEWLTRLNADVEMPFSRAFHLPHAACALVGIAVSSVMLWGENPAVFGLIVLFTVPHIVVSQLVIARAMPGLKAKTLEASAKNTVDFTALITCADVSALYGGTDYLMGRFEQSSRELYRANMKLRARNALGQAILPLFGMGGYLTLLIVCVGWIAAGQATFGGLVAAFQYRGGVLAGSLTLINALIAINESLAGTRRLNAMFFDEKGR